MGMHIGLIAAKTSVDNLIAALFRAWPQFEHVSSATGFPDADAMWAWKQANEKFVSAADWSVDNPGTHVYMFWQDGEWALLLDPSYTLASDEERLGVLSTSVGSVISFVVESAGGCAFFWSFEDGTLRRSISNSAGDIRIEGEPLAEERGIDVGNYYMDETEALWHAFGISPEDRLSSPIGCQAVSVIDRTDYGEL